jgi:hypothetical protein
MCAVASCCKSRLRGSVLQSFLSALDVDRVGIVAFDQINVIAIHFTHEICQSASQAVRNAPAKAIPASGQIERDIGEFTAILR